MSSSRDSKKTLLNHHILKPNDGINSTLGCLIVSRNEGSDARPRRNNSYLKIDTEDGTLSGRTRNFREVFLPKNDSIKIIGTDRWVLKKELLRTR